jgi:hypothetical protein
MNTHICVHAKEILRSYLNCNVVYLKIFNSYKYEFFKLISCLKYIILRIQIKKNQII